MSFLQKIKDILGIGGVKMQLMAPKELNSKGSQLKGKVILTAKSEKEVSGIEVNLKEIWRVGSGEDNSSEEFELGETKINESFTIKPGETKEFDFELNYELLKSENDRLVDRGGVSKGLGKLGKMMDGEKSNFWLNASADVKGTVFGPSATEELKLTK